MTTSNSNHFPPAGYWIDPVGRLVHESQVKPIDIEREALIKSIIGQAKTLNQQLREFKLQTFANIAAFIELSAEQYEVKIGGTKGNTTLVSYNGQYKIQRQIAEHISFDERLQAAKALVDNCISNWASGSNDNLRVLINDAFQVDKEGNISTSRVLSLRRINITDPDWLNAMQAIADSITIKSSKSYVRIYERVGDSGEYKAISLDIAAV